MRRTMLSGLAAVLVCAGSAAAQGRPVRPPRGAEGRLDVQQRGGQMPRAQRQEFMRRIRQAMARAVREKVGLDDAQMRRLVPVNQKYAQQRRDLAQRERDVRVALRRAMMDTSSLDQAKIAEYQNQLLDLQRQRIDIVAAEQKDLLSFMTPLQVARYRALQEQVRRRVDEMRQRQGMQQMQGQGTDPFGTAPDTSH